jgi:prefoldin subunit 5
MVVSKDFIDRLNKSEKIWMTASREPIKIKNLQDDHLANIITMLDRNEQSIKGFEIKTLRAEIEEKKQHNKQTIRALSREKVPVHFIDTVGKVLDRELLEMKISLETLEIDRVYLARKPLYRALLDEKDRRAVSRESYIEKLDLLDKEIRKLNEEISEKTAEYNKKRAQMRKLRRKVYNEM